MAALRGDPSCAALDREPWAALVVSILVSDLASLIPTLGAATWVLVMVGALVVGLSKTAMPGGGTIAVGLFALGLPAKESTAALLLLLMVGDATALWVYRREPDVRTLVRLIPSVLIGIVLGTVFFATVGGDTVRTTIGVILLVLIAVTVWRRRSARVKAAASTGPAEARGQARRSRRLRRGRGPPRPLPRPTTTRPPRPPPRRARGWR